MDIPYIHIYPVYTRTQKKKKKLAGKHTYVQTHSLVFSGTSNMSLSVSVCQQQGFQLAAPSLGPPSAGTKVAVVVFFLFFLFEIFPTQNFSANSAAGDVSRADAASSSSALLKTRTDT